ncbi:MAG: YncE family protein [Flavisolibacter sp.]
MNYLKAFVAAALLLCLVAGCQAQPQTSYLQLVATIPLPHVSGRIDHLSFDSNNNFVFVAALGNNTVEVVDLTNNTVVHSIQNLHEPQGVAFIAANNSVVVANGDNGNCDVFNTGDFKKTASVHVGSDADNVRYDAAGKKIYVGYGSGGMAVMGATTFTLINEIKLAGHPESFQIDKGQNKMFVNVPGENQIEVIDLSKDEVIAQWKNLSAGANFPMALDEANHRLFVGCRHPSKLLVLNSETGRIISDVAIDGDTDDIFYNAAAKEIYVSCGSGYVNVLRQIDADHYTAHGKTTTRPGARTSLFIAGLHWLLIAAPAHKGASAQLMIYKTK